LSDSREKAWPKVTVLIVNWNGEQFIDRCLTALLAQTVTPYEIILVDNASADGSLEIVRRFPSVRLLARRHGVPFYVACPLSTIDLAVADGVAIPIEERSADEVTGFRECQWAAKGVQVRNPAFDVTPAELVTALITEKGVVNQPKKASIASLFGG
jgi:methylthioribose-1-phosphate isomerase